jgi:hypothetical protein
MAISAAAAAWHYSFPDRAVSLRLGAELEEGRPQQRG